MLIRFSIPLILLLASVALAGCKRGSDSPANPTATPPVSGLDARPSNTRCVAGKRPSVGANLVNVQRVFPNLEFNQPVAMLQAPNSADRWYVVEKPGTVVSFVNDAAAAQTTTFIDLTAPVDDRSEGGLLGMAFHPNYATNGYVFLSYTTSVGDSSNFRSVISRFSANAQRTALDPNSELVMLTVKQPYDNHDGGNIGFGPDGFLYIGFGDGGSGGDPENHGQDPRTLLGAMLRIDVNVSATDLSNGIRYKIPAANPFSGTPVCVNGSCPDQAYATSAVRCAGSGCAEIFAWGLRNPWRWSFDRLAGDLWVGDVGQNTWEEVDRVEVGKNYGWHCYEGTHDYETSGCGAKSNYTMPVTEYDHSEGQSITGGFVYRGNAVPALAGAYIFGDYGSGNIWALTDPKGTASRQLLIATGMPIASFAQDNDGELYALQLYGPGAIFKLVPGLPTTTTGFPNHLTDTGCAAPNDPKQGDSGMVPYDVNAVLWSDGAVKKRWMALPDGQTIHIDASGDFQFPVGTVLRKDFYLDDKIIETRLLAYHTDGDWAGYSYEWDDAQTDATLVVDAKQKTIGTHNWYYPSGSDCLRCHTVAAGRSLGPDVAQLNRAFEYAPPGKTGDQLFTYASIGMLDGALSDVPANLPALVNPQYSTAPLEKRARAYLQANCAHCHRPGGPGRGAADFRYEVTLADMHVCDQAPETGDLGVSGAKLIVAGNPSLSLVSLRMQDVGVNRMPPLTSSVVDTESVAMIDAWITSLKTCP